MTTEQVEHHYRWRAYLWERTKYKGVNMSQALDLIDKEPDLYAVFCAIDRIKR